MTHRHNGRPKLPQAHSWLSAAEEMETTAGTVECLRAAVNAAAEGR